MSDQEVIDAIAKTVAAARNSGPNSNDRDFATKFLHAYRAMLALQKQSVTKKKTPRANLPRQCNPCLFSPRQAKPLARQRSLH